MSQLAPYALQHRGQMEHIFNGRGTLGQAVAQFGVANTPDHTIETFDRESLCFLNV